MSGLLTTVSYWENLLRGDPHHRFKWSLLPLAWLAEQVLPSPSRIAVIPATSPYFFPIKAERSYIMWGLHESSKHDKVRVKYSPGMKDMMKDMEGAPWVEKAIIKDALLRVNME